VTDWKYKLNRDRQVCARVIRHVRHLWITNIRRGSFFIIISVSRLITSLDQELIQLLHFINIFISFSRLTSSFDQELTHFENIINTFISCSCLTISSFQERVQLHISFTFYLSVMKAD